MFFGAWLSTVDIFSCFSVFLGMIKEAFDKNKTLKNLLLADFFKKAIADCQVCLQFITLLSLLRVLIMPRKMSS